MHRLVGGCLLLPAFLSGCTLDGPYIGWDAEARFSEYDDAILRDAMEALGWNASFHGSMPGFSADLEQATVYYGERGSGYVLVVQFTRNQSVPYGELDDAQERRSWEPVFEAILADFERETGWKNDGVRWLRISGG